MIREYEIAPNTLIVLPEYRFLGRETRKDLRARIHPEIHRRLQVVRPEKPNSKEFLKIYENKGLGSSHFVIDQPYNCVFWNTERCLQKDFIPHFNHVTEDKQLGSFQEVVNFEQVVQVLGRRIGEGIFASHYHLNKDNLLERYSKLDRPYSDERYTTGIATFCNVDSVKRVVVCSPFREPVFGSYKASVCTVYPLDKTEDIDDGVLVINAHTSLFWGMREHLSLLYSYISSHKGPVIAQGDWNTWHDWQLHALNRFARSMDLNEISLGEGVKSFDGRPLDRLLVRKAKVSNIRINKNDLASDHASIEYSVRFTKS